MKVITAVVCMVLSLFLLCRSTESCTLKAAEACEAAEREPEFGDVMEIPASLKDLIVEYKNDWRKLCSGVEENTIYPLYHQAKEIERRFSSVFEEADGVFKAIRNREGSEAAFEKAEEIHSMLRRIYPSFIPLFKGSYIERNYFKASLADFQKYAFVGDAEDSLFFKNYSELRGETLFAPWIRGTWDYGGCFRFGEYQWVDALEKIDFLKKNLTKSLYREVVIEFEKDLKDIFKQFGERAERGGTICSCENKNAVPRDLRDILENVEKRPEYEEATAALRKVLNAIEKKEVIILSDSEKHCSGG